MHSDALEEILKAARGGLEDNGSNGIPLNPLISYSSDMEKANQCQTWHSSTFAMDHHFFGGGNNTLYLQATNTANLNKQQVLKS